jgi:predicted SAM-dependent methyltransferase
MSKTILQVFEKLTTGLGFPEEFGRVVLFELQAFLVRWGYRFHPRQRRRLRKLRESSDLRVHFGCGANPLQGWVNIDGVANPCADLLLDIRHVLPLEAGSAKFIFAEQVLEHLRFREALLFLQECHRILAPGGVIRILTPDLEKFTRAYVEKDQSFFQKASPGEKNPIRALNLAFRRDGFHHYLYDQGELERVLRQAEFIRIIPSSFCKSRWPELNLDHPAEHRREESLYVEAVK